MTGFQQDTALIRALIEYAGVSAAQVAKKARVDAKTVQRPAAGRAEARLSLSTLEKLQAAYPDFPGWVDRVESPRATFQHQLAEQSRADDVVEVEEIDLRYGMGSSDVRGPVEAEKRVFSRAWLRNFTDARPGELYWAIGQGDSMEPTISSGDLILIDRSQDTMFDRDLIWACTVGDFGMIKRLRPSRDGVIILSDNPNVPDDIAVDDELRIIGRVIAKVGKL